MNFEKIECSILNKNLLEIEKLLKKYPIKNLYIDVMDGYFVDNLSNITPFFMKDVIFSWYKLHIHFMVNDIFRFFPYYKNIQNIEKISFHIEQVLFQRDDKKYIDFVKELQNSWIKVWLAIKPKTSIDLLLPYIDYLDFILIMTVEPWEWGQKFLWETESKIKYLRLKFSKEIIIDGGVTENIMNKLDHFVDKFIMWSCLFNKI